MNRAIGLLFALFVVSAVAFAFSERPAPEMPPTQVGIGHLLMLDAAAVGTRLVTVGERGYIFLSDDGGYGWRQAVTPNGATLTAISVVGGRRLAAVGHDGVILLSDDAGERWRTVFAAPQDEEPLLDVWFDASGQGLAVGAYGRFLESTDGGATWEQRRLDESDLHFNAIARAGDALLLAGEAGLLLRSDDGGQVWTTLPAPYAGSFFGLLELPDNRLLLFGMRGHAYLSEDAGASWQEVETGTTLSIFGGHVLADGRVLLVGQNGLVLLGEDRGRRFVELEIDSSSTFSTAIAAGGMGEVLLLGEHGFTRLRLNDLEGSDP